MINRTRFLKLMLLLILIISITGCSGKKMNERYGELFILGEGVEYRSHYFEIKRPTNNPYPIIISGNYEYSRDTHGSHAETIGNISFQMAKPFTEDIGCVKLEDKWGYVILDPLDYDELLFLIEPKYEGGEPFSEGLAAVKVKDKYGFIDIDGEMIVSPMYENVQYFYGKLAPVKDEKGWHFIDTVGNKAFEGTFEDAGPFFKVSDSFLAPVKKYGKWGYINSLGKIAIDYQFDDAWAFDYDNKAAVRMKNKWFYINKAGGKVS